MTKQPSSAKVKSPAHATAEAEPTAHKPRMVKGFDMNTAAGRAAYKKSLPRGGRQPDKDFTDKLRAEAAAIPPDAPPNRRGRPTGTPNQKTQEKREALADAMRDVFSGLTHEEVETIKPLDIFRLVTIAAVRAGDHSLAMLGAEKWAPYVHAKIAPIQVDTSNGVKRIVVENAPESDDED